MDDACEPQYDVLTMPRDYGLRCPELEKLKQRFYDSTSIRFAGGNVHALRNELIQLREAYRARREPELIEERRVRARDPNIHRAILEAVLKEDTVYRVLEEFQLLCEEAITAEADVRCEGD